MFGDVVESEMRLNAAGRMVEETWVGLPSAFGTVSLNVFQVMPNHLHGVLVIEPSGQERGVALPDVMQCFKALTTKRYAHGVGRHGWPRFDGRLWQRSYYEHIVRDDRSLERVREYVSANPANWSHDRENPSAAREDVR